MSGTTDRYADRVRALERRASDVGDDFAPDPPDDELAMHVVRTGFGPTVSLYCEARTGDSWVRFDEQLFDRLEATMNDWLGLYAACYGREVAGAYGIREAAELLVDTHNARDTAQVLTGIPER